MKRNQTKIIYIVLTICVGIIVLGEVSYLLGKIVKAIAS